MSSPERVDALIVVALRPELDAVLALANEGRAGWREAHDSTGAAYYVRDEVNARGQAMRVGLAWLGDTGQETASARVERLIEDLDPLCMASCGVCAGLRGPVRLGDLILADRVVELVKLESQPADDVFVLDADDIFALDLAWKISAADLAEDSVWREPLELLRPPSLWAQTEWILSAILDHQEAGGEPPAKRADRQQRCPRWTEALRTLLDRGDVAIDREGALALTDPGRRRAQRTRLLHPDGLPGDPPFLVHMGALATSPVVLRDPRRLQAAADRIPRLRGVDMEAAALVSAAARSGRKWLVVKGVADLADDERDAGQAAFARQASASFVWTFLHRHLDLADRAKPPSDRPEAQTLEPLTLERLVVTGFKNIAGLDLDLAAESKLGGRWTCLAGINGSGKTSVLQAIALALLGDKLAEQLGSVRLARMVRSGDHATGLAHIVATVRVGAELRTLGVPLCGEGIDSDALAAVPEIREMRALWDKRARRGILAAYGASRNLSEYLDNRHESLHLEVQRQMTLFDPQARVARAGLLLAEDPRAAPVIVTLRRVLEAVLAGLSVAVAPEERTLRFAIDGAVLPVSALPDGFRSTVAWLGDLCALWHEKALPEDVGDGDPARIHGIVLIDEIDLHLHPSLQRVLVPRLRAAMPRVQWIVTTHSPLVLASFDRSEIKMLDSAQPDGVRELDRDVLGFTTDQIYAWLMGTTPRGVVLEEMLKEAARDDVDPARREQIAAIVATAPDFNEEDAKKRVAWRRGLLTRLSQGAPEPAGDLGAEKKG